MTHRVKSIAFWFVATALCAARLAGAATGTVNCDESMKTAFRPDAHTTVLLVKKVKKGDAYPNPVLEQRMNPSLPAKFAADLCWVKLLVGPGVAGLAAAPSTSRGIGIEVWLPAKNAWSHRVHAMGSGGWGNGNGETVLDKMSTGGGTDAPARVAAEEGAVTSTTDNGQQDRGGSFAMNPDGSLNAAGLQDWSYRGLYEQAVKTKALATAYYGSAPKYSYFEGASGGGRQAHHIAQNLPEQYDGILSKIPGVDWISFIAEAYPALLAMRDLDGKDLSKEQLEAVSGAAVAACDSVGGQHLGFILDIRKCRYDPAKDPAVLCKAEGGDNDTPACVTRKQALVMNKIWYGQTIDGTVPDPAVDNGWGTPLTGKHIWHGFPRGGVIFSLLEANTWQGGPTVGRDLIALAFRDPKLGGPPAEYFGTRNARGNGENGWQHLSYEQLAAAYKALRSSPLADEFNANNPDLTRLRHAGTKLMHVVHLHDGSVWLQGHTDYYDSVIARMGGLAAVQQYYRMYILPGLRHAGDNGSGNRNANPPVPAPAQLYGALVDWVEKGKSPDTMVFVSPSSEGRPHDSRVPSAPEMSLPACAYPKIPTYVSGDIHTAGSYQCN